MTVALGLELERVELFKLILGMVVLVTNWCNEGTMPVSRSGCAAVPDVQRMRCAA